jgi:hypothetical protein
MTPSDSGKSPWNSEAKSLSRADQPKPSEAKWSSPAKTEDVTVEDCEDFEFEFESAKPARPSICYRPLPTQAAPAFDSGGVSAGRRGSGGSVRQAGSGSGSGSSSRRGQPLSLDAAKGLRSLLFGDPQARFNHAWLQQEFTYNRYPGQPPVGRYVGTDERSPLDGDG